GGAAVLRQGRRAAGPGGECPACRGVAESAPLQRCTTRAVCAAAGAVDPAECAPAGRRPVSGDAAMTATARLTIVVAAFEEARALPLLHPRIAVVMDALAADGIEPRVLYVDDGSGDATWEVMQGLAAGDARVALLRLSRNFGKEAALTAGLDLV